MNTHNRRIRAGLYDNGIDRGAQLFVKSANDGSPIRFKQVIALAEDRIIINIAGGCKGLDDAVREQMFPVMAHALRRTNGTIPSGVYMSGGTRDEKAMVTQVPTYLASLPRSRIIAVAHTPKTSALSLKGQAGRLTLNDYGTRLDTGHHAILLCQPDMNTNGGWDYDVPTYLELMTQLMAEDWKAVNVVFNGGDITRDGEIYGALSAGVPVLVVDKSGREADGFAAAHRDNDWSRTALELRAKRGDQAADAKIAECQAIYARVDHDNIHIATMNDVASLRAGFAKFGIL